MTKGKKTEDIAENEVIIDKSKEQNDGSVGFFAEKNLEENIKDCQEIEKEDNRLEISEEYAEQKVQQVIELQSPKKKRKNTIINLCLLLINFILMFYIIKGLIGNVGEIHINTLFKNQGARMWWLVGGLLIYVVYILVQTLMYYVLIKDITGKKRFGLAYDVAVVGKYYDNVTPFAVGGQPMQILRLAKNGISAGTSTSLPIMKMMLNSAVNMILAVLFFIFGVPKIPVTTPLNDMLLTLLILFGVIGLVITIIVVVFTFLIASGGLVTRSFISGILRIGYKLRIVKNYRQTFQRVLNQVTEYKVSFRFILKNKKTLFKMLGLCLLECLSYAIMPYFVVQAFAETISMEPIMFLFICLSQYYICAMASSFIPLPGGTGIMELSFIFLFGIIVGDNIVWALLAWRILSYYLILVHGFVHELVHIGKNMVKSRKRRELK